MKLIRILAITVCCALGSSADDYAQANIALLDRIKGAQRLVIDDWRGQDGPPLVLDKSDEIADLVSLITFENRPRMMDIGEGEEMEAYCQCIGDFRLTFTRGKAEFIIFLSHWEHLIEGESSGRQIYLTARSGERLKRYLLSYFPPRPGEEKRANKPVQRTGAGARR